MTCMLRTCTFVAVLCCTSFAVASPVTRPAKTATDSQLKIVGDLINEPYTLVKLSVTGLDPKAAVLWQMPDSFDDKTSISYEELPDNRIIMVAPPGVYRIQVIAVSLSADGKTVLAQARVVVIIKGVPAPPQPPVPPAPVDPVVTAFQAAYDADTDPNKSSQLTQLAAFYQVASTSTVNDPSIPDLVSLLTKMQAARKLILPDGAMVKLRNAVGVELNKTLMNPIKLDAAGRAQVAASFSKVAKALEAVKP